MYVPLPVRIFCYKASVCRPEEEEDQQRTYLPACWSPELLPQGLGHPEEEDQPGIFPASTLQ